MRKYRLFGLSGLFGLFGLSGLLLALLLAFPSAAQDEPSNVIADGLNNANIAEALVISEKTVKTHLTNIFDKLKVNNRFKAALLLMGQIGDAGVPYSGRVGRGH